MSAEQPAAPTPRRRLPNAERRALILEAARETFLADGFHASMGDIATAAGITRTVLYHYFPSKRDLFVALVEAPLFEFVATVAPAFISVESIRGRAEAFVEAGASWVQANPREARLAFSINASEPELEEFMDQIHELVFSTMQLLLSSDAESIGVDPESIKARVWGEMIWGACANLANLAFKHPEMNGAEVSAAAIDLLLNGLLPRD